MSGGWARAHAAFLVAPLLALQLVFYQVGLIVGISAVGPWLYFCSVYTGRILHWWPAIQRLLVAVFLVIVLVKLTNPLHRLYFQTELVATPFPHLAVYQPAVSLARHGARVRARFGGT